MSAKLSHVGQPIKTEYALIDFSAAPWSSATIASSSTGSARITSHSRARRMPSGSKGTSRIAKRIRSGG